jgi:hypothetical protein
LANIKQIIAGRSKEQKLPSSPKRSALASPARVTNPLPKVITKQPLTNKKPSNIIKKVKEMSLPGHELKKKILDEKNFYEEVQTLPNKVLKVNRVTPITIRNTENSQMPKFDSESGMINMFDNPSKGNNTIDTKGDIYQILSNLNVSDQNSKQHILQFDNFDKNITFHDIDEEIIKYSARVHIANNNKHIDIDKFLRNTETLPKKEEFIKNKYKHLLDEYFTN